MAEITYLARVLHWPLGTLLDLEHDDRRRLIALTADQPQTPDRSIDLADLAALTGT